MRRAIAILSLTALSLSGADWPRFRGPNGAGIGPSGDLPVKFNATTNLVWRTEVPFSHSSPVTAGDRLYLTGNDGDKLITLCLDRRTGKPMWRREVLRTYRHKIYKGNDPTSPTPATDGVNIYVFYPDVGMISYGPDGNERWRRPLGPFRNFYGLAASPVVAGDSIIQVCDQLTGSFLVAIDRKTGAVRWKTERRGQGLGYATPIVWEPAKGELQVITSGSTEVAGYSVATGTKVWWYGQGGFPPQGVTLMDGSDLISFSQGADTPIYPPFADLLAKHDKNKDGKIAVGELPAKDEMIDHFGYFDQNNDGFIDAAEYAIAMKDGVGGEYGIIRVRLGGKGSLPADSIRWRYKKGLPYIPAPLLHDGILYMVKEGGIVTALNPATGEAYKAGRATGALGNYTASPVAAGPYIYLASEEGKVTVLKAGREWEIAAVNDLGEEISATPAIVDGRIYIRTAKAMYCFGK